jgi:hypothetical protein
VAELEQAKAYAEQEASFTLTPEERAAMQTLAGDLSALWQAETTTHAERKQLLRLAIESVQLDGVNRPGWIEIQIRWRSGVVTRLDVKRPKPGEWSLKTPEQAVARIHELAADLSYAKTCRSTQCRGLAHGLWAALDTPARRLYLSTGWPRAQRASLTRESLIKLMGET